MIRAVQHKKEHYNSKVYVEVNKRADTYIKGKYVLDANLGVINLAIKRAIEHHKAIYPKESIEEVRLQGRQIEWNMEEF